MPASSVASFDFLNQTRDITNVLSQLIDDKLNPRFIRLFPRVANATNTRHEWPEDQVKSVAMPYTANTGGVLTMAADDAKRARVGQIVTLQNDSAVFEITQVNPTAITVVLIASHGSSIEAVGDMPATGVLTYVADPMPEGSSEGPTSFRQSSTNFNQTQIFRDGVILTETATAIGTIGNENTIVYQEVGALRKIMDSMNKTAIHGVRIARTNTKPGMAGGLYEFGTQADGLSIELGTPEPISDKLINDAAANITGEGGNPTTILCGVGQARVISQLYKDRISITAQDTGRGSYVMQIRNDTTGGLMSVFCEPNIQASDVWVIDPSGFGISYLRPIVSKDATKPGTDGTERSIIGELTFEFKNAKARLCRISGLTDPINALV